MKSFCLVRSGTYVLRKTSPHSWGICRSITERKQAEEAFRQSEERLGLLVQGVKDYAILMLDPEGRVTTWNGGAERIKGYRAEEIIGKHFSPRATVLEIKSALSRQE